MYSELSVSVFTRSIMLFNMNVFLPSFLVFSRENKRISQNQIRRVNVVVNQFKDIETEGTLQGQARIHIYIY